MRTSSLVLVSVLGVLAACQKTAELDPPTMAAAPAAKPAPVVAAPAAPAASPAAAPAASPAAAPAAGPGPAGKGARVDVAVTEDGWVPNRIPAKAGVPLTLAITRKTDKTCATEIL